MPAPKDVCYWRGRVGGLVRDRDREDPELIEARRNLAEANIHHYIQRVLAAAPPLSDEQVSRLRDLLRPNTSQLARDALDDRDRHTHVSQADRDLLDDFGLPETYDRAGAGSEQAPIRPREADADDRAGDHVAAAEQFASAMPEDDVKNHFPDSAQDLIPIFQRNHQAT